MCRLLRRTIVATRKPRTCAHCGCVIMAGQTVCKTEYAEPLAPSSRESIRVEWSCCQLDARPVNWFNGPNKWRPARGIRAALFRVA